MGEIQCAQDFFGLSEFRYRLSSFSGWLQGTPDFGHSLLWARLHIRLS